ncbi:MAG: DNA polymerase [Patescibacteria group bacterium]
MDAKDLSRIKTEIISYELNRLIPYFKNIKTDFPIKIIDVCLAARLVVGQPYEDKKREAPWSIWQLIKPYFKIEKDFDLLKRICLKGETNIGVLEISRLLGQLSSSLINVWQHMNDQLEIKGEKDRFYSIENPVQRIMLRSQYRGIRINTKRLLRRLDILDEQTRLSNEQLRDQWGIIDVSDKKTLAKSLKDNGYDYLAKCVFTDIFDDLASLYEAKIDLLFHFQRVKKAERDKGILLRFGAIGSNRVFPYYDSLGTVTGRATVTDPHLQQLKRENRDIIASDREKILIYPDFSQFEPGILADDAKDKALINLYNSGDVYTALGKAILGEKANRDIAKKIFLSFSFGMKKENLVKMIFESTGQNQAAVQAAVDNFFDQFKQINEWKKKLCDALLREGRIGTRNGNYRYRPSTKETLSANEEKWVISQRIQGTASLILKRAILAVDSSLGDADFLLPMHDAVLYQVPKDDKEKYEKKISEIFEDCYMRECDAIKARVSLKPFDA